MKQLFRYQLVYDLKYDGDSVDYCEIVAKMQLKMIDVIKETKGTFIINDLNGKERRIMKDASNTYAHESKEDALRCFYFRTRRYASILAGKSKIIKELLKEVRENNNDIIIKNL